jgi:Na+/H+-dicarboxylate symporter
MSESKSMSLSARIFLGMILGAIVGLVLNYLGTPQWSQVWLIDGIFNVVGSIFSMESSMWWVPFSFHC